MTKDINVLFEEIRSIINNPKVPDEAKQDLLNNIKLLKINKVHKDDCGCKSCVGM